MTQNTSSDRTLASDSPLHEGMGLVGQVIGGRYHVDAILGQGGMGVVFAATHQMMRKPVAIKVLRGELSQDEEMVARFEREAQAAGSIDHPNVCSATDFGRLEDGSLYLVMEYLEGRTLSDVLCLRERLDPLHAVRIVDQILSVLEIAHAKGIVHRDLKPDNIMLVPFDGRDDLVKVMDFGIASIHPKDGEDVRLTRAGVVYGTPTYMSTEQIIGKPDIDGRADIYAVGAMLHEMITGSPPYDGESATVLLSNHLTAPIPSLDEDPGVRASLPVGLSEIVSTCLAKEREDRFASVALLRAEIARVMTPVVPDASVSASAALTASAIVPYTELMGSEGREQLRRTFSTLPPSWRVALIAIPALLFAITILGGIAPRAHARKALRNRTKRPALR